jgi:hypothetical protein
MKRHLVVDWGDPEDIRRKQPEAEAIADEADRKAREAQALAAQAAANAAQAAAESARWRGLATLMAQTVRGTDRDTTGSGGQDSKKASPRDEQGTGMAATSEEALSNHDLVVKIVNKQGAPMRIPEVGDILRGSGFNISNESVRDALHYGATRAGTIQRLGRGVFAPRDYETQINYDSPEFGPPEEE